MGVGVPVGVAVGVGVSVGEGVAVGVSVSSEVGVSVGSGVRVAVGDGARVGDAATDSGAGLGMGAQAAINNIARTRHRSRHEVIRRLSAPPSMTCSPSPGGGRRKPHIPQPASDAVASSVS